MKIVVRRFHRTEAGTSGVLLIDGQLCCYTVERPWLDNQRSVSCIPAGRYDLVVRKEQTDLTRSYRARYDFFTWHLMIKDVPNRSGIYIHSGNKPAHVKGCLCVGESINLNHFTGNSRKTYEPLYEKLSAAIEREPVQIDILNTLP